jgi:hypothetical protein
MLFTFIYDAVIPNRLVRTSTYHFTEKYKRFNNINIRYTAVLYIYLSK